MVPISAIQHFIKQHTYKTILIIGVFALVLMMALDFDPGHEKDAAHMTALPDTMGDGEIIRETCKKAKENATETAMVLKAATLKRNPSEENASKTSSRKRAPSRPIKGGSPEDLARKAENALMQDSDLKEKLAAIRDLENLDDPIIINAVMLALDDPDPDLRKAALEVVRHLDFDEVNNVFLLGLADNDLEVVEKTMRIMAESDSAEIIPSLEQALLDDDEKIKKMALMTLEDISDTRAVDLLIESGLHIGSADINEDIFDALEFITGQRFENYQEASIWWLLNKDTFEFDQVPQSALSISR